MRPETRSFATRVLLVAGVALAVLTVVVLLRYAAGILLTVFAGVLLSVALRGLAEWLTARTGLRRGVSLALVVFVLLAALGGGAWALGDSVAAQASELMDTLPGAIESFKRTLGESAAGRFVLDRLSTGAGSEQGAQPAPWALGLTLDVITGLVLMAAVALFVAAQPDVYARGMLRLLPPARRRRGRQVLAELDIRMRRWLLGKLVTMVIVAVVTSSGLALIGVPLPLAFGVLAGLLNFVPYVGPVVAFVPAALLALTQGMGTAGAVAALWVGVQTLEGYVLTPLIDQESVDVPPALQLSALAVAGALLGTLGVVLGAPLTAVLFVLVQRLYVEDVLGDDLESPADRSRARAA
jgi:predicted PurR-regulated permease PerM